jgi:3-deoxy-D-manno-oct-2-ulosonic acid (Kdo) hydroxylase
MQPFQVILTGETPQTLSETEAFTPKDVCGYLEQAGILFFPDSPFQLRESDREFLLTQEQMGAGYHKNIAYRAASGKLTGLKSTSTQHRERLLQIMQDYSQQATLFVNTFLAPYKDQWQLDYATFRPNEEEGRKLRLRARNDLLHVDSFPTRPTYGSRILRVFTNIHPTVPRVWRNSCNFKELLQRYHQDVKPYRGQTTDKPKKTLLDSIAKLLGLKMSYRSAYDGWMMDFHNFLKENRHFQTTCSNQIREFPPGSSWVTYTDQVSHAVMSGHHALEQTFIVDKKAMVLPSEAPIHLLEKTYGLVPTYQNVTPETKPLVGSAKQ